VRRLAWAFAAGIVLQVFFIGLGLFVEGENLELHTNFGWLLHIGPLLVLVAAALARAGRAQILQATALAGTIFFVPIMEWLRRTAVTRPPCRLAQRPPRSHTRPA
jgi:hypothetical protein